MLNKSGEMRLDSADFFKRALKNAVKIFVVRNSTAQNFTDIRNIFAVDD